MADTLITRISRAWNAFRSNVTFFPFGARHSSRPDRSKLTYGNERSIIASIYNRIALDIADKTILHVKVDENERYLETIRDGLNDCLTVSANLDQTGAAFLQDAAMTLFDEGCIAIVPIETTGDPTTSDAFDILSMRVGKVVEWYPGHVKVDVYNERTAKHQEIILPKRAVAIVENPLFSVMNEPNSTLKRLIAKLNLLDSVDSKASSGRLDLIVQLPYLIKTAARKQQAEERLQDIEDQLANSAHGIAYTDGTEKIVQLNRPVENNLLEQIKELTSTLYSQLGLTTSIMDGTADEATMVNYYSRTVDPIAKAIRDSMYRTFISKTARTQGHRLMIFKDPFKLATLTTISEAADKLTRAQAVTPNEIRSVLGFKPSNEPTADKVVNENYGKSPTVAQEGGMNVNAEAAAV